jgi:predicted nucleic acid-binding protein
MIKALIDTNIILDIALKRNPFYEEAATIFRKINEKELQGYISATTVTDIFYLIQKDSGKEKAIAFLQTLIKVIDIMDVSKQTIINALHSGWNDIEDAVQAQVAIENDLDVILTRNTKDFKKLENIKVFYPSDFIDYLNRQ